MKRIALCTAALAIGAVGLWGCHSNNNPPPVSMAPPVNNYQAAPMNGAPPMNSGTPMNNASASVYNWPDVPVGQTVPISRATFDQGGYQIYATTGETILVPFANQNLYVLKFGRSNNGQEYFLNDGSAPTLYLPGGAYLENAALAGQGQGGRWYPIPQDYAYTQPMYVSLAPSWNEWTNMGWYPGMVSYGGMWGYSPYAHFAWMPSFYIGIGGARYTSFTSYHTYYTTHTNYVRTRTVYNYSTPRTTSGFGNRSSGFGRPSSGFGRPSSGFGRPSSGFGRPTGGSFGGNRGFGSGSSGSPGGSFGGGRSTGGSFGGSRPSGGGSSFGGSRPSGGGGSFGGGRSSGGSFRRRP